MCRDKEKAKQNSYKWRKANPDKVAASKKKHREKYRDKIRIDRRNYALRTLYNISQSEYENLLLEQKGCCAVCGTNDPQGNKKSNHFQVDHDHNTGKVRGLLCCKCNRGLGLLGDNVESIEKVLLYLKGENVTNNTAFTT